MTRHATSNPQVRAQFTLKLACGYLHDACHDLARLLAHPHLADGTWRLSIKQGTVYWWRARVHLKHVAASEAPRLAGRPASRFTAWCREVARRIPA